jgi:hypothetical protein
MLQSGLPPTNEFGVISEIMVNKKYFRGVASPDAR